MKDVLVFDMDGVLVDVSESYRETIRATVKHFTGHEITRELIQEYKNAGGWNNDWALSQKIIADLGLELGYDMVVEYFQAIFFGEDGKPGYMQREKWLPEPDLLERLAQQYRLAIFTGRLRSEAIVTLHRFVPDLHWHAIVADDDVPQSKPAPDGLRIISAKFPGAKLLYLGDTVDDARSAKQAGVPFIGIAGAENPNRGELVALLNREGALAVIGSINGLETVLCAQPR